MQTNHYSIMKKILGSAIVALAACMTLSSCNNNGGDSDTTIQYPIINCFALVHDTQSGAGSFIQGVNYTMLLNVSQSYADISITGLNIPDGQRYPSISLPEVPAKADKAWLVVSSARPTVDITGFGSLPVFRDLVLRLLDRYYGGAYVPGFTVSYSIDDRYRVFSAREGQIASGTIQTTAPDGSVFEKEDAVIGLAFDTKTMMLEIQFAGAQFVQGMPAQNITMSKIPFTMTPEGVASFSIASLTPTIGSTPYPNYPITDLVGTYDFNRGLDLNFVCTLGPAPYHVKADMKY